MTNNIKELIKLRDTHSQNLAKDKIPTEISNFLDQEIIQNYKIQNSKLNEEVNSLTRNFEALSLKNKEDNNLIKKLEIEINFYKNKLKSFHSTSERFEEEKNYSLQNLKDEIQRHNNMIKNLEIKNKNLQNSCEKLLEKEIFFKTYSSKLYERNKTLISSNENLEKENSKMKKELKSLKIKEEELSKSLEIIEKLKKEKELIEKLLQESRDRIKLFDNTNEENFFESQQNLEKRLQEAKIELKEKLIENENLRSKIFLLENEMKTLKHDCESSILEKNLKIENMMTKNKNNIVLSKDEILTLKQNLLRELEVISSENFKKEISDKISKNENILKSLTIRIKNISTSRREDLGNSEEYEKITSNLEDLLRKQTKTISEKEKLIKELSDKNIKYQESNEKLSTENNYLKLSLNNYEKSKKSQIEILEKKISNKRTKLSNCKKEIDKISSQLDLTRRNISNSIADRVNKFTNLFSQIKFPAEKLKLSIDTLLLILPCRSCSDFTKKLHLIDCGHSLCIECIEKLKKTEKPCIECKKFASNISSIKSHNIAEPLENFNLNDIIVRFQFINQTVDEIDLIINTINENFP